DQKILVGGLFTTIGGQTRNRIARLNTNGTADTFNPNSTNTIYSIAVQPDGKVLVGGAFATIQSTARNRIARFDAAGAIDTTFNANLAAGGSTVYSIAVQPDGKILFGGDFTTVSSTTRNRIARVSST